jgi:hypothetical protein
MFTPSQQTAAASFPPKRHDNYMARKDHSVHPELVERVIEDLVNGSTGSP